MLNALFGIMLACIGVGLFRLRRKALWRDAFRRLYQRQSAKISIAVIAIYISIGALDSVGWKDPATGNFRSVIDRVFQRENERTYSAPMAVMTTGEPIPHNLAAKHIFGTDGTGEDVLYQALKGCRTALIIGGLTSGLVTPLAIILGMPAGYFGKRVDDAAQFFAAVLDSIPSILMLVAIMLVLGRGLAQLCIALGITTWVGLFRIVRAETMKHRDREYARAARALGATNFQIMTRHILPNITPLIVIGVTLRFSGLVLAEAVLSYLQIGVEPGTGSWGNMIDGARLELARDPIVWWNLLAATSALFVLVLAFNILGDALRDAIDVRLRSS
ncbi:MAG: ABC transporter permease [Chthonomonadales bacterium]